MGKFGEDIDPREAGARGGQASAEARRAEAEKPLADRLRARANAKAVQAMDQLIAAALGETKNEEDEDVAWSGLSPDKRLDAVKTVLAYSDIGPPPSRTGQGKKDPEPPDKPPAAPSPSLI